MLFGKWQLKTTVCILLVATCLGQELFRLCERDYCYERSVERRAKDPTDSEVWHRYHRENLEREESTPLNKDRNQRDEKSKRVIENGEYRGGADTLQKNSEMVKRQTLSDVTRHLGSRMDERREFLTQLNYHIAVRSSDVSNDQRQTLRQLKELADTSQERLDRYETLRRLGNRDIGKHDNHFKLLGRLDERKIEHDIRMHSEDNQEERRENLSEIGKRYIIRNLSDAPEYQRIDDQNFLEPRSTPRYNANNQKPVDRDNTVRRFDNREFIRELNRRSTVGRDLQRMDEQLRGKREKRDSFRRLSEYDLEENHDTMRKFDDVEVARDANRHSQRIMERKSELRRNENRREHDVTRRTEGSSKERTDKISHFIDRKTLRNLPRTTKSNREEEHYNLRRFDDREPEDVSWLSDNERESENNRERVELFDDSKWFDDRETQRNIVYRENNLRRFYISKPEQETDRRLEMDGALERIQRSIEYKREREERRETLRRMDYHKLQRDDRRSLESDDTLRRFDALENVRGDNRFLRDSRNSHRIDEKLHQRKYGLVQRKMERSDSSREFLHLIERDYLRERETMQPRDNNQQEREERYKTPTTFDDYVIQNDLSRRSDVIRESQHSITRHSRREHEPTQRGYENKPNRQQRLEISRRFENREVQREDNRRLEDKREKLYDREIKRDNSRRSENRPIDEQLSQEELVNRRLDRRNDRATQYDTSKYLAGNNHETVEILEGRAVLRDTNRRLDVFRAERYKIMRQLDQREVSHRSNDKRNTQRLKGEILQREHESIQHHNENKPERVERSETMRLSGDRYTQHDIKRNLGDTRASVRNDKRFEERNAIRRVDSKKESRFSEQLYQVRRDPQRAFIRKQKSTNSKFIEEEYIQKPSVLLKKGYMVFGQGTILAYIIIKTLNGKNNLQNFLPTKLREAMGIICF